MERITKTQWLLLGVTAVYLCALLAVAWKDLRAEEAGLTVQTQAEVPQAEVQPDLTPLDLNAATAEELTRLPGIGEELARRIVEDRTKNGPYETVEDILRVSGIGEGKLAAMEGRVAVNGEDAE